MTPRGARRELSGWGRTAPTASDVVTPVTQSEVQTTVAEPPERGLIARGLGRSYGDAAQNAGGAVVDVTAMAGVRSFDPETGVVEVAAGTSLDALMRWLVPRGWFVPVTPGTRFVTVGGAVASDIHGKNHHRAGTWCAHVEGLSLATPGLGTVTVGPDDDPDLFWATAGGMGLTGVVLDATVQMRPIATSRAIVDTDRTDTLADCMDLLDVGDEHYEYTVAWVDLLPLRGQVGRSVITRGRFATLDELPSGQRRQPLEFAPQALATVPPVVPSGLLSRWSIQAFNEAWWRKAPRQRRDEIQTISRFFHPLDGVEDWNRLHGPRGFLQWQVVVPFGAEEVLREVADTFAATGVPTLIGVLKRFGAANPGPLSFPLPGWTLSLDIPTGVADIGAFLDRLDAMVVEAGGRIYLAKDSRVRPELVPQMYPRLEEWQAVRRRADPDGVLRSDLSRRLRLSAT